MAIERDRAVQDKEAAFQRMNNAEEEQGSLKLRQDQDQAMIDRMSAELQQMQGLAQVRPPGLQTIRPPV